MNKIDTKQFKDRCWFCDGTGQVPALFEPTRYNSVHHIRMYGCKCSKGSELVSLHAFNDYFSKYKKPQFEEEAKEYDYMSYFQVVYFIKNQRNIELNKEE